MRLSASKKVLNELIEFFNTSLVLIELPYWFKACFIPNILEILTSREAKDYLFKCQSAHNECEIPNFAQR